LPAGVALVKSLACCGDASLHSSFLAAGAVPALVDVVRAAPAEQPLAAAATAALGALATSVVPGAAAAVCGLMVSCLQPGNPAVAANAAAALMTIAGEGNGLSQAAARTACRHACTSALELEVASWALHKRWECPSMPLEV
jgi:hypothetical protein